jgi:hypothetical protein
MLAALCIALLAFAVPCGAAEAPSPEDTVRRYLAALKAEDFDAAYPLVTASMAQHKGREEWVKDQQWVTRTAEVKILAFRVFAGTVEGETAYVPNLLSSQDAFVSRLGVEEHELYTLVREGGTWRISCARIVEPGERSRWFPAAGSATAVVPTP